MEWQAQLKGLGDCGTLVSMWDARRAAALDPREHLALSQLVAEFGRRSAVAQGLGHPITDLAKLEAGGQRLYLAAQQQSSASLAVFGGLKVGEKALFVWPPGERRQRQVSCTCVLDFYVHERVQRMGIGHALFQAFLQGEGLAPGALAYDAPSPKLLSFLEKHYSLRDPVPLTNNFVVFPSFFQAGTTASSSGGSNSIGAHSGMQPAWDSSDSGNGGTTSAARQPAPSSCWESVAARPLTAYSRRGRLQASAPALPSTTLPAAPAASARGRAGAYSPSAAAGGGGGAAAPWDADNSLRLPRRDVLPPLRVDTRSASVQQQQQQRQQQGGPMAPQRVAHPSAAAVSPARARALVQRGGGSVRDCLSW